MSSPWLVAIGAGKWQVHGIRSAQAAGIRVLALDGDEEAPGLSLADRAEIADISNPEEVISVLRKTGLTLSGVIAFCSEVGMASAAAVRSAFDLSGPGPKLTERLRNKGIQRREWSEKGSPTPMWRVVRGQAQAQVALAEIGLPLIVKPIDSAGSRGVSRVDSESEFDAAVANAQGHSKSASIIIESYIVGTEYTIESFSCDGETEVLLITRKDKVENTRGTVASGLTSVDPDSSLFTQLAAVTRKALSDLGYRDGPGHTEIIVSETGEPILVESAGRGGGFGLFDQMIPLASGFDIAKACALQAVGLPFTKPADNAKQATILRFVPTQKGRVIGIHGFGQVSLGYDVHAEPLVELGQVCGAANSDGDRMAYILTTAENMEEAERLIARAESTIHFEMSTDEQSEDNRYTLALG